MNEVWNILGIEKTKDTSEITAAYRTRLRQVNPEDDPEGFMENYNTSFVWDTLIDALESLRQAYNKTKDIRYWKELIRLLPESWLQTRTIDLNYEVLRNIYKQRFGHRLSEWSQFREWIERLPYAELLITDTYEIES